MIFKTMISSMPNNVRYAVEDRTKINKGFCVVKGPISKEIIGSYATYSEARSHWESIVIPLKREFNAKIRAAA